jgi:hypothetical protein
MMAGKSYPLSRSKYCLQVFRGFPCHNAIENPRRSCIQDFDKKTNLAVSRNTQIQDLWLHQCRSVTSIIVDLFLIFSTHESQGIFRIPIPPLLRQNSRLPCNGEFFLGSSTSQIVEGSQSLLTGRMAFHVSVSRSPS